MGVKVRFLDEPAVGPAGGAGTPVVARIPQDAVARDGDRDIVWVVKGDRVERRAIRLGGEQGGLRDVIAGIAAGETLVVKPDAALADGQRIRTTEKDP